MHHGWLSVESTTTTADCLVRSTAMNGQSSQRAPGMSALAQRLPGQRTPADPSLEQPNAADLTYGWHRASSSDGEEDVLGFDQGSDTDSERVPFVDVTEEPARQEPNVTLQAAGRQSDRTDPSSAERSSMRSNWPRWWSDANGLDESSSSDQQQHPRGSGADGVGGPDAESFVCRICFDGPGSLDEGGESLGKLIAPCRCRGTMKFVHQGCLTRWRATSRRQTSVMQCDQCGAPYRFRKSRFVGLATNRLLLMVFSCYMFISIVWLVGFTAERTMGYLDNPAEATKKQQPASSSSWSWWKKQRSDAPSFVGSRIYQSINLDRTDDASYDGDPYYRYDYRYAYSEPAAYYTLIKAAIKYVGSGRAFWHISGENEAEVSMPIEEHSMSERDITAETAEDPTGDIEMGWWSSLVDDWKYGRGGIWEGQRPAKQSPPSDHEQNSQTEGKLTPQDAFTPPSSKMPDQRYESDRQTTTKRAAGSRRRKNDRYDARAARELGKDEQPIRPATRIPKNVKETKKAEVSATWLERLFLQLSLGASLVGMSSFLTLLLGISTWGPFHLNLGLGRGFARLARRRARGAGNGGGGSEGEAVVAVFLLFLVFIGIIRALFAVYSLTNYISKRLLIRVEDIILDWGADEDTAQDPQPPEEQRREQHRQSYWQRWQAVRGWRRQWERRRQVQAHR